MILKEKKKKIYIYIYIYIYKLKFYINNKIFKKFFFFLFDLGCKNLECYFRWFNKY